MGRFWKMLCLVFAASLIFCGCQAEETVTQSVVERVNISGWHDGTAVALTLTEQTSMEAVLDYLRLQRSQGRADVDPERILGNAYTIEICLSNGQTHIYRQRADRYLSKDNHPWQKIDPDRGSSFYALLSTFA